MPGGLIAGVGYLSTFFVFAGLVLIFLRTPQVVFRPSFMFLGFYWLQVQFSAAINHQAVTSQLNNPWVFVLIVHLLPLATVATIPFTFQRITKQAFVHLQDSIHEVPLSALLYRYLILLGLVYTVLIFYLTQVPFTNTGLYALVFYPDKLDQYREYSMKLLDNQLLTYSFAIMEKVLAPMAGAFAAFIAYRAMRARRYAIVLLALVGIAFAAFPTTIYGARGPMTMVIVASLITGIILIVASGAKPVRVTTIVLAALIATLVPISLLSTLKSNEFSFRTVAYHTLNIADRAIGRGFIDNVWHLRAVELTGYHGVAGIPKVAYLLGIEPKDTLNLVGRNYNFSGNALFKTDKVPEARVTDTDKAPEAGVSDKSVDIDADIQAVDTSETSSAGAFFVVLNFTLFGFWSIPVSYIFVLALDLLLYVFVRIPKAAAAPVVGAISVPILSLSFSFATTVLASKGLLITPALGWLLGQRQPKSLARIRESWLTAGQ